jgi:sensor histidine kinase YesM
MLMNTCPVETAEPRTSWSSALRTSAAIWSVISVIEILARYGDRLNNIPSLLPMSPVFFFFVNASLTLYCAWLYRTFQLLGERHTRLGAIARLYIFHTLCFQIPWELYFLVTVNQLFGTHPWRTTVHDLLSYPIFNYVLFHIRYTGIFCAVYALHLVRSNLYAQRRQQRVEAENAQLRLTLEQQRLASLRAQLEPHFMFNALNAISALVRAEDKRNAVTALSQLSMLLRYALVASTQDWVKLGEELRFLQDYLALQSLRFGDRLQVELRGDLDALESVAFPPLLLQPLVENAIRHNLERHTASATISIDLAHENGRLQVRLSNGIPAHAPPNPGFGLGLTHTRERLRIAFAEQAHMEAGAQDGQFVVSLDLPTPALA